MNILYAVQGTGNGHLSRAREIIPHLLNYGDVDLLVSGTNSDVALPYIIKYKKHGLSFVNAKQGNVDYFKSFKQLKPIRFFKDILTFPVNDYDVVLNDFEPLTAWACKLRNKPCIALSHQSAFLSKYTPRPKQTEAIPEFILRNYAPTSDAIGFHFNEYDTFIKKPIIRSEIRQLEVTEKNHIAVYLPAYHDQFLINHLFNIRDFEWHIFSKHCKTPYRVNHIKVLPIENTLFLKSLASSSGLITGGGFESPAEAMYLNKKVMSIPILGQYEQCCNAISLKKMGVTVVAKINRNFYNRVMGWLEFGNIVDVIYPNETDVIVSEAIKLATIHNFNKYSNYIYNENNYIWKF